MGKAQRQRPARLADKLAAIRHTLGLSQNQMLARLGLAEEFGRNYISAFELGTREPPLPVLLQYARVAGIWVDVLIDDALDLPPDLPDPTKREGIRSTTISRRKKR